jgi:drug/metabolite transporter (DMT)-like permease
MSPRSTDVLALCIGLLAVSVSAILVRLCISDPMAIAFWRLLLAGSVFTVWTLARGQRISAHDFKIAVMAALFLALHFYLWISSLFMTSINSSVVLLAIQPLFALVLQVAIHRIRATRRNMFSLSGGLIGAVILAHGDFLKGGIAGQGDVFAIISAALAATYLFTGSHRTGPLIPYLATVYMFAGAMLFGAAAVRGDALVAVRPVDWFWFAMIALIPTLLGHTMLNRATKVFPPYVVNLSVLVEPLIAGTLAYFVFAEIPTGNVLLGATFIVGAVVVEVVGGKTGRT